MVQSIRPRCSVGVEIAADNREHQHFAERRHDRREAAGGAGRQLIGDRRKPFVHLRARPVDVSSLREFERHEGRPNSGSSNAF